MDRCSREVKALKDCCRKFNEVRIWFVQSVYFHCADENTSHLHAQQLQHLACWHA